MGTRSTTRIYKNDKMILALYCQFDGYPTGVGVQLADFIKSRPFVNGLTGDAPAFNGPGCFAAQLVAHLKAKPGLWYITGEEDQREEFNYEVRIKLDENYLALPPVFICEGYDQRFEGKVEDFAAWADWFQNRDED